MNMKAYTAISAVAATAALVFFFFFATLSPRGNGATLGESDFQKLQIEKAGKRTAAPDFTLEDLSDKRASLKQFRGRVVFLNFWATWCIPCREEMPAMEKLHRAFRNEGLEVVAVNFRENKQQVRSFFDELGLTFIALLDKDGKVSEKYGVWSLPLTYFINRRGEFVGKAIGSRNWNNESARNFFLGMLREKD